ncbi:MAG TPA: peptidylprolyl isomerase [Ramlibacter sp.]|nr:peptidylprolyl isomerase [Ramlibacter sp.]
MIIPVTRRAAAAVLAAALGAAGSAAAEEAPKVRFQTTAGEFVVEVYPDKAPKTVENFLQYVRDKHYDGTIFHRVINDFMIQGGGYDTKYSQKSTRLPIRHEGQEAAAKGGPKNVVGTIAMARTSDPHSASAQFFINVKDNPSLDPVVIPPGDPVPRFEYMGRVYENQPRAVFERASQLYGYTVFGKVVSGMDVVNKIKATPTGAAGPFPTDVPKTPVVITSATLMK